MPRLVAAATAVVVIATVVAIVAFSAANAPAGREEPLANCLAAFAVALAIVIVAVVTTADNSNRKTGPGCSWPCGDLSAWEAA